MVAGNFQPMMNLLVLKGILEEIGWKIMLCALYMLYLWLHASFLVKIGFAGAEMIIQRLQGCEIV